ncbi:MAG: hypothetical protein COA58_06260 [Bacteroidetes bacterium]|nr:MAG: hypothetical protein COA58_06260 [Bacteroidota bacterium]
MCTSTTGISPEPDSVRISWDHTIPGSSFTVLNTTDRFQTGRFCWQTSPSDSSNLPYSFIISAKDNACPINAVTLRTFRIRVSSTSGVSRNQIKSLSIYPNPSQNRITRNKELDQITIYDILGNKIGEFKNTTHLDISQWKSGVYVFIGVLGKTKYMSRFIVE